MSIRNIPTAWIAAVFMIAMAVSIVQAGWLIAIPVLLGMAIGNRAGRLVQV